MALSVGDQERVGRSLKRNIVKRDLVVDQLTILSDLVKEAASNINIIPTLQARAADIELFLTDLRIEQDEILTHLISLNRESEFLSTHAVIGKRALEMYYSIKATMSEMGLDKREPPKPVLAMPSIQLPKIQLPTFNGEILQWCTFRDTFRALVHNNAQLSNIQKFHYLLSIVSGPAVTIIRSLPLTENNYPIVWDTLIERYDNKRGLLNAYLDAIFRFPPLTKESLPELQRFVSTFDENIAAIDALEVENISGYLLFYIASRVLDPITKRLFEFEHHNAEIPTFDMLSEFVKIRCQVLLNSVSSPINPNKTHDTGKKQFKSKSSFTIATPSHVGSCIVCKDNHTIYQCSKFAQKNVKQRFNFARDKHLCMNCLSITHKTAECSSTSTCKYCASKHHSLLHLGTSKPSNLSANLSTNSSTSGSTSSTLDDPKIDTPFVGTSNTSTNVVLGTAVVRIQNNNGEWIYIRVLIDTGSQVSVITNSCVLRLGLKRRYCKTIVTGLSQTPVSTTKGSTGCILIPRNSILPQITCEPIILSRITGPMPAKQLPTNIRATYAHLDFADPQFDVPRQIDFLLGADIYPNILGQCSQVIHTPGLPSAYETRLGWIVLGQSTVNLDSSPVSLLLSPQPSVNDLIRRFWEIEEPIPMDTLFTSDQKCEDHFSRTTTRDLNGRFSVSLPFKNPTSLLGNSRDMAVFRFFNLERKLMKDPIVYDQYRAFMQEYEDLGHMKVTTCPGKYIIPHHAVIKHENNNIKLRVVFDASAKSSSGISLNDILYVGPKLQSDISELLHRCRLYKYMFTADICKMYRQIYIAMEDRPYQHILWRTHISQPLVEYELNTVTYGVTSSPFQAIRVLHQLETEESHNYTSVTNTLSTQTYVDDIISGHDTTADLLRHQEDITKLLLGAGFELKKWSSNCDELLHRVPPGDRATTITFDPKDDSSIKILGLHWNPISDKFSYHTSTSSLPCTYTKRLILSTIAKIYDPLGALGPIIFWAKCFMQLLWCAKVHWDDPIPKALLDTWIRFSSELPLVAEIKLNRYVDCLGSDIIQLIGFSDASEKGYAATVYLRHVRSDGSVSIHFITAKSKVAPLKVTNNKTALTVPRLELCGALLLSQTINRIMSTFSSRFAISEIHAWTDSRVVLSWLTSTQTQFKIFVTNRLAKIAELIPTCHWHYISSDLNPADCVSRGLFPSEVITCDLYWNGPPFLTLPESEWPNKFFEPILPFQLPDFKEIHQIGLTSTIFVDEKEWVARFSSLTRLQRVISYVYRFIGYSQKSCTISGSLTLDELDNALMKIIKITQQKYFSELIKTLRTSPHIVSPRSLAQLAPFIDDKGIVRVGGRLRNSQLPVQTRHPILLPKSSTLTTLIIRHFHINHFHAAFQLVSSLILRRYWILSSRLAIRHVIFKCVVCARHKAITPHPFMADLPSSRVTPSRPFLHVGIDFAGPLLIKESRRRNARSSKCYLAVFVCMVIKSVHLEIVSDLSTDAFIASLHRFVARRGIPSDIYTDCGTNFKGADQQLRQIFNTPTAIDIFNNVIHCKWHFNPPAAPHFGGLWEAAVKSAKYHLKRVVGEQILTFEEMSTLTSRIEAILNSRPLTPMSADPNDYRPLTPGDFLIGAPLMDIPDPDIISIPKNRVARWELLRQLHQSFWKRWSTEYLTLLQSRPKWINHQPNVKLGDLVLLISPNQAPTNWKLGRIERIHPGTDGVVRVATVRTANGTFLRPIVKLAVLPIDTNP